LHRSSYSSTLRIRERPKVVFGPRSGAVGFGALLERYRIADDEFGPVVLLVLRLEVEVVRVRSAAFDRLFEGFDAALRERGFLAMGGQIVDGEPRRPPPVRGPRRTIVEARRPRLNETEKAIVKGGGTPEDWKPARTRQVDRDGRWTLKRGRKRPVPPEGGTTRVVTGEILVPAFGYKNHLSIDRQHGLIRRFAVTHAAAHDGSQLGAVLDPANTASQAWADTA
jgi:transposase, IS5 family